MANVEILKRRKKRTIPCVDIQYDEHRIQEAIKTIGCKPSVIEIGNGTKHCDTLEEYNRFEEELALQDYAPPCREIQSLNAWHGEDAMTQKHVDVLRSHNGILRNGKYILLIQVHFTNDIFKEVIYLKAYTIESLIGNAGGYIGKFHKVLYRNAKFIKEL